MKKILCSLFLAMAICTSSVFAVGTQYYDINNSQKQTIKRCQCKKYFEEHLGLTAEQIQLVDANRKAQEKELKPINAKIRAEISDLKAKSAEVKANHNKTFESYLTKDQLKTLEYMREQRKQGKSCCPCGKNRYY